MKRSPGSSRIGRDRRKQRVIDGGKPVGAGPAGRDQQHAHADHEGDADRRGKRLRHVAGHVAHFGRGMGRLLDAEKQE